MTAYTASMEGAPVEGEEAARDAELMAAFNAQITDATVLTGETFHDTTGGAAPPPPPPPSVEWFYADGADPTLLHGPFTTAKLKEWYDGGHFTGDELVRPGRDGVENVKISTAVLL